MPTHVHRFSIGRVTGSHPSFALALCTPTTLAILLAAACQTNDAVHPETARLVASRSTTIEDATATHASGAREVALDVRSDGARLLGVLEPAPPDSDADRVLVLQVRSGGASIDRTVASEMEGTRVLDGRFVDEGIVTIGVDHVLRLHANGHAVELDELVEPPLSVAGGAIAYARGHPPNLEIARTEIATGNTSTITHDMNPAWSPALTADGTAIVFVSGIEGTARFYRAEHGAIRPLPRTERTPSAPVAPRFEGALLHFVDHLGDAWLDPERGEIVRTVAPTPIEPSSTTGAVR